MLLNGNRNWNIPVYECLIRLNYHSHEGDQISNVSMLLFDLFKEMKLNKLIKTDGRI